MMASAETLFDSLVAGYKNSGLLTQNRALLRVADEDVAIAVSALRPIIEWTANSEVSAADPFNNASVTASLELALDLTLFDGGANRIAIAIQQETVRAVRASLTNAEQQVLMRVIDAHFDVRKTRQTVSLQITNAELMAQELESARARFEVGEITRTDISLTQARLAAARAELAAAQGNLVVAHEEFQAAVGHQVGVLRKDGVIPAIRTPEKAFETALRMHPDILEAEHRIDAAKLGILLSEAAMRPKGTLHGEFDIDQDLEQSGTLSMTIGGPVCSGGALSSALRQSRAELDQSRAILHLAIQDVYQNVANAYTSFDVAGAEVVASQEQVNATRVALKGTREEATLGLRTQLDILNAQQDLLEAETALVSSRIEVARIRYVILEATGMLTAKGLGLPVETYDPDVYSNQVRSAPSSVSDQGRAFGRIINRGIKP